MKINFNNKEIELKYTLRSDMIFENIMDKSFKAGSLQDWVIYFYSSYLAMTKDTELSLDDFINILDEDVSVLYTFIQWYVDFYDKILSISPQNKEEDEQSKKQQPR